MKTKLLNFLLKIFVAVMHGFTGIFTWRGRASRFEFWIFWLATYIIGYGLGVLNSSFPHQYVTAGCYFFAYVCLFATISYAIRRFHDTNRTAAHFWSIWGAIFIFLCGFFYCLGVLYSLTKDFLPMDITQMALEEPSWDIYVYLIVPLLFLFGIIFYFVQFMRILFARSVNPNKYDSKTGKFDWPAICVMTFLMLVFPAYDMLLQIFHSGRISVIEIFSKPAYENIVDLNGNQESVSGEELLNSLSKSLSNEETGISDTFPQKP